MVFTNGSAEDFNGVGLMAGFGVPALGSLHCILRRPLVEMQMMAMAVVLTRVLDGQATLFHSTRQSSTEKLNVHGSLGEIAQAGLPLLKDRNPCMQKNREEYSTGIQYRAQSS